MQNRDMANQLECEAKDTKQTKLKTEPANPFLQFLSAKKKEYPGVPLNMVVVREEWKGLTDTERKVYKDLFKSDKEALGNNYRKERKRKLIETRKITAAKTPLLNIFEEAQARSTVHSNREEKESFDDLLDELEILDDTIDVLTLKNDKLKSLISAAATELAIKKHSLTATTDSFNAFRSKYEDVVSQHNDCYKK